MNLLWDVDATAVDRLRFALGADAQVLAAESLVTRALHDNPAIALVAIGPDIDLDRACALADSLRISRPEVGVVLLRHRLDVTALTTALRSGIREVVAFDDHGALAEAVRRSRELTERITGGGGVGIGQGKVITVFSSKGGVGKTTLSTNLAVLLKAQGRSVLIIDLDLAFGDVAITLQLSPQQSVFDAVAMSGHLDEQGLASMVTTHEASGVDCLCAPIDPGTADRVPAATVAEILKVASRRYDYILVDTPPAFTEHVLAAIDSSDLLVLIATLDIPAIKNLRVALDTLDVLGNSKDDRLVVLNRADAKVGLSPEDVARALKRPLTLSVPSSLAVPAATNRGVPIVQEDPRHPVTLALKELADTHIRRRFETPPEVSTETRKTRSLWSRR